VLSFSLFLSLCLYSLSYSLSLQAKQLLGALKDKRQSPVRSVRLGLLKSIAAFCDECPDEPAVF